MSCYTHTRAHHRSDYRLQSGGKEEEDDDEEEEEEEVSLSALKLETRDR